MAARSVVVYSGFTTAEKPKMLQKLSRKLMVTGLLSSRFCAELNRSGCLSFPFQLGTALAGGHTDCVFDVAWGVAPNGSRLLVKGSGKLRS